MRITGGLARGILLDCPPKDTRPATDALREALYSSLGSGICGVRMLDLFAGTGAYGLEALSRGATWVTFIEKHKAAVRCLQSNLEKVCKSAGISASQHAQVIAIDVFRSETYWNPVWDVILADPPYAQIDAFCAAFSATLHTHLTPNTASCLILEAPADREPPVFEGLELHKRLGKSKSQSPTLLLYKLRHEA